jgi:DNA repair photolyase
LVSCCHKTLRSEDQRGAISKLYNIFDETELEKIMGEHSKIEWTDHTFNPWIGCQHVSPGCDHCYAEAMMDHRYGRVELGPQGE